VHIRVAVSAFVAHVSEDQFRVALGAGNGFMHATQRIAGLVVIKFREAANRRPAVYGVAVLARNRQSTMRAARAVIGLSLRQDGRKQHEPNEDLDQECRNRAPQVPTHP